MPACRFSEIRSHTAQPAAAIASSVNTARLAPQASFSAKGNTSGRKEGISPWPMVSIPASAIRAKMIRMQPGTANRSSAFPPGTRRIPAATRIPSTKPRQPPAKESSSHRGRNMVSADQFRRSRPALCSRKKSFAPAYASGSPRIIPISAHRRFSPAFPRRYANRRPETASPAAYSPRISVMFSSMVYSPSAETK